MALANSGFLIGVWRFKKWGVYGSVLVPLVILVANLLRGTAPLVATSGLIIPAVVIVLVRNRWDSFE
jgi:hypothetical protein